MAKKSILIASASESLKLAKDVAQALAKAGYRPLRWWHEFPAGSITLDRLLEISKSVDGAVFICEGVDKTWYRGAVSSSPRDNVVLEYGIFVTTLGRERALVLSNAHSALPSDISAITYETIIEDTATVSERTVEHFNRQFADSLPPKAEAIPIVVDPVIVGQQISEYPPDTWHQRDLYFGIEGAKGWLAAINDPAYSPRDHELRLRRILLEALDNIEVRTFVSFGPGDADIDEQIAIKLRNSEPWLQYIPVDISDGLLQRAVTVLSDQVRVPIGILGDFEERLNFIHRQLRTYGIHPMLFALLGNTLGNLDRYEESFLSGVRNMMKPADFLLLDASLAGPDWKITTDRRGKHDSYGHGYRRFIATGVARRSGESIESIIANFEKRICFEMGGSDVDKTNTIAIVDAQSRRLVQTIRRYDLQALRNWLEKRVEMEIVYQESIFLNDMIGDAVILAKTH